VGDEETLYDHGDIKVDGAPARIVAPSRDFIRVDQLLRSELNRVDVEVGVPMADSDKDGMPDWWEDRYGLNKYLADDAHEDKDGDFADNLQEFLDGTDPTVGNQIPMLLTEKVVAYEGGASGFLLEIADSDSFPDEVAVTLTRLPPGLRLRFFGNNGTTLQSGDELAVGARFTLADMMAGNVFLEHDGAARETLIGMEIKDESHPPAAVQVTVQTALPSRQDGTDAIYWADALSHAEYLNIGGVDASVLKDRSGHGLDGDAYSGDGEAFPLPVEQSAPSGQWAIEMNGSGWVELPYGESVFPDGNVTVFSVFRSAGAGDQIVASGPFFEIGVSGTDHPSHPGEIRLASETEAVYGNHAVPNEWIIAEARKIDGASHLYLDGSHAGGPFAHDEATALGTDPVIGAKTDWK
jgi:hypothetical protein